MSLWFVVCVFVPCCVLVWPVKSKTHSCPGKGVEPKPSIRALCFRHRNCFLTSSSQPLLRNLEIRSFLKQFCPSQPIRFKHSQLFQGLYVLMPPSLTTSYSPVWEAAVARKLRAKTSTPLGLRVAARLVATPVGEPDAGKASIDLSAAMSNHWGGLGASELESPGSHDH